MGMNDQELAVVNRILDALSSGSANIVASYTTWMIAAAVAWIVVGVILLFMAAYMFRHADKESPLLSLSISLALGFFGLLFIATNVPDLVSPQAMATHQLIKDIRGGK